jgi:hypothetical protein
MAPTYSPTIIDYPDCRKCGTKTRVVQIEPGKPGFDKRTFICSECNHADVVFVKYE